MVLSRTITEQQELAKRTIEDGYVCMILTGGDLWTWSVVKTTNYRSEAEKWFDQQYLNGPPCRVYLVNEKYASATLIYSK